MSDKKKGNEIDISEIQKLIGQVSVLIVAGGALHGLFQDGGRVATFSAILIGTILFIISAWRKKS